LLVNKTINEYVRSVQIQLATVIGLHCLIIGYFFPMFLVTITFVPATFYILWCYIALIYEVEGTNRDNLIALINASEHEPTRKLLLQELWYADLHSLGGVTEDTIDMATYANTRI
tara:strand:- start:38605 stop:38949 length:345 start_codon:yes stop_codon:yes gene_type:complete